MPAEPPPPRPESRRPGAAGVQAATAYHAERPTLSFVDLFPITLADLQGWQLFGEDRTMRDIAESRGIACMDALWALYRMTYAGIPSGAQDLLVLEAMSDGPRYSVPKFLPVTLSRQLSCGPSQVGMYICTAQHLYTRTDRQSDISIDVDLNLPTKIHL